MAFLFGGEEMAKYRDWIKKESLSKLEDWARDGLIDEQIARNIGISPSTLYEWKNRYPEISESLKRGKLIADQEIESALHRRAKGYVTVDHQYKIVDIPQEIVEVKRKQYENRWKLKHPDATLEDVKDAAILHVRTTKRVEIFQSEHEVPSDTTAAIFWLKNRKPKEWRDKHETELSGEVRTNPYAGLSTEELRKLAAEDDTT